MKNLSVYFAQILNLLAQLRFRLVVPINSSTIKLRSTSKLVFLSGFLVRFRADISKYFKRKRDEKSKKDGFEADSDYIVSVRGTRIEVIFVENMQMVEKGKNFTKNN